MMTRHEKNKTVNPCHRDRYIITLTIILTITCFYTCSILTYVTVSNLHNLRHVNGNNNNNNNNNGGVMTRRRRRRRRIKGEDDITITNSLLQHDDESVISFSTLFVKKSPQSSRHFPSSSSSSLSQQSQINNKRTPDYGGIDYRTLRQNQHVTAAKTYYTGRMIRLDPNDNQGHVYNTSDDMEDYYYDDDDGGNDLYYAYDDDNVSHLPLTCRRVSWQRNYYPNCNAFHEFSLVLGEEYGIVSNGHFRDAWLPLSSSSSTSTTTTTATAAIKTTRLRQHEHFDFRTYENVRLDALIMERLTSSPRITDIYGHCGTSVVTEALLASEFEERVLGDGGGDDDEEEEGGNERRRRRRRRREPLTSREKLELALTMAQSVADLHGFDGGVIVHDDLKLGQFLFTSDGRLKLNDYNFAEVMFYDEEKQEYCRYEADGGAEKYLSPEQLRRDDVDEKIDVYTLGHLFMMLLQGRLPYGTDDHKVIFEKIIYGKLPRIDNIYRNGNHAERTLVKVIERCLVYDPDDRADIFEIVELLMVAWKKTYLRDKNDAVLSEVD